MSTRYKSDMRELRMVAVMMLTLQCVLQRVGIGDRDIVECGPSGDSHLSRNDAYVYVNPLMGHGMWYLDRGPGWGRHVIESWNNHRELLFVPHLIARCGSFSTEST